MADKHLFNLDADARWRLAYDKQQWVLQRRQQGPRPGNSHGIADSGWRAVSFIGGTKTTLGRLFRERGISLTPQAQAQFDGLPEQFMDFIALGQIDAQALQARGRRLCARVVEADVSLELRHLTPPP